MENSMVSFEVLKHFPLILVLNQILEFKFQVSLENGLKWEHY